MGLSNQFPGQQTVQHVVSRYFHVNSVVRMTPVSTGGFSGAALWRIEREAESFCLRQWPPTHPSLERLQYIHGILQQVAIEVSEVAQPISDRHGQTIIAEAGTLWELSHWKPGVANYHQLPSKTKLTAAMRLLCRFHHAAGRCTPPHTAAPTGLVSRREQLARLLAGDFERVRRAVSPVQWPELFHTANQVLNWFPQHAPRVNQLLNSACESQVPLQPCIRDIWHDHVLFTGERVTGLVDFGALREDHVAADITRLLGSLVRDDQDGWQAGLAAYEERRQLSFTEARIVAAYDQSAVLLSGLNWLQWLYLEGRQFDNPQRVQQRLAEIVERLARLGANWQGSAFG